MFKLMIVDDSAMIRMQLASLYQGDQFDLVAEAADGEQAVEKFREFKPDVVTMDLTMPNVDGIACIEKLVNIDSSVRILVVSALNDKMTGMEALEKGAMGFIHKPISQEKVVQALSIIIED
ncbi:MAG: response regulator [Arenicella sp.]